MKIDVLTNRYSPSRAGANTSETLLNQTNVNVNTFGKIFTRSVDGQIYAQPLIVSDTARVLSVQPTDPWAKAGVMIRAGLDATSVHAMMVITPGNGAAFQFRSAAGGPSTNVSFPTAIVPPFWVRLVRAGNPAAYTFTGFVSVDGVTWSQAGQTQLCEARSRFCRNAGVRSLLGQQSGTAGSLRCRHR